MGMVAEFHTVPNGLTGRMGEDVAQAGGNLKFIGDKASVTEDGGGMQSVFQKMERRHFFFF